jgi:hypothetical protein
MTAQARPATAASSSFSASAKPPPQPQLAASQWQSSLPARPATAGARRANPNGASSSSAGAPFSDVQFMTATGRSGGGGTQQMHAGGGDAGEDLGETIDMNDEQPPETTATPSTKLVGRLAFACVVGFVCQSSDPHVCLRTNFLSYMFKLVQKEIEQEWSQLRSHLDVKAAEKQQQQQQQQQQPLAPASASSAASSAEYAPPPPARTPPSSDRVSAALNAIAESTHALRTRASWAALIGQELHHHVAAAADRMAPAGMRWSERRMG